MEWWTEEIDGVSETFPALQNPTPPLLRFFTLILVAGVVLQPQYSAPSAGAQPTNSGDTAPAYLWRSIVAAPHQAIQTPRSRLALSLPPSPLPTAMPRRHIAIALFAPLTPSPCPCPTASPISNQPLRFRFPRSPIHQPPPTPRAPSRYTRSEER